MYTQTWSKYIPVVKILMKRSANGDQVFDLNVSDFKQAGATRKIGYKFTIDFANGKVENILASDLARDFAAALLDDQGTKELIMQNNYQISMNAKFQLTIKFVPKASSNETVDEELVTEEVQ